ncbi:phosphoribosylglycinamide formyltransferase [Desulfovibrio sp. JC022]|uniref:phosphoribosylglycinamide formyltransferase n=1 Tax=Desulfovibrio sp. JC022 TaxID=2593642 RepID=UPI0013D49BF4|nr:phosphoribosylglycinamide formyltransferase [Desulfovibrio sp. JC022]NDV24388.1 phosphoribosylglycinamide formyltransferase [Desulfovibrio sp. JC022]
MSLPIAVLISGGGSNLQSIIEKMEDNILDVDIRMVLSNKADAYGLKRAEAYGIPTAALSHKDFGSREEFDAEMVRILKDAGVEAVIMAGFMRIITPVFLNAFPGKIINIHPAILPSFPGVDGQGDAAKYGVQLAGCTVHFVDEKMDHGAVVIQAAVPAYPGEDEDELRKRILKQEHRILPQAVQWLATGRLSATDRFVKLAEADIELAKTNGFSLVNPPLEKGF